MTRRRTGPTDLAKALIHDRDDDACVRCRTWQDLTVHHRVNKGMGRAREPWINQAHNLLTACPTEVAVCGVSVGEGDVVGVDVGPDGLGQGDGLEPLAGGEAREVLPDKDARGRHRLAAQHGGAALPADENDPELGGWFAHR
ncbi:hypothetical protein [Streptomyces coeruleofuscus]|uniref:HNH endonuclease n=1 Tax=Streptomyces coeruleofuscus TaxID=66879 RepID=A0ABN3JF52_9ACTN